MFLWDITRKSFDSEHDRMVSTSIPRCNCRIACLRFGPVQRSCKLAQTVHSSWVIHLQLRYVLTGTLSCSLAS